MIEKSVLCPACGKENPAGADTCKICGLRLDWQAARPKKGEKHDWYASHYAQVSKQKRKRALQSYVIILVVGLLALLGTSAYVEQVASQMSLGLGGSDGVYLVTELGSLQSQMMVYKTKMGRYATFVEMRNAGYLQLHKLTVKSTTVLDSGFGQIVLTILGNGEGYTMTAIRRRNGMSIEVNQSSENVLDTVAKKRGWKKQQ